MIQVHTIYHFHYSNSCDDCALPVHNVCVYYDIKAVLLLRVCHASCVVWLEGHLVFGGESGDIHVWKTDTLKEITRHKAHSG